MKISLPSRGFTIVELLIVIVVIGILAAMTIVSYNGIQTRAENTKTLSGVDQVAKAIQIYKLDNSTYPLAGGATAANACISSTNPASCGRSGTGSVCGSDATYSFDTNFETEIKKVIPSVPSVSSQAIPCGTRTLTGAIYRTDSGATNQNAYIIYYLRGEQQCTTPGGSTVSRTYFTNGATRCELTFAA